MEHTKIKKKRFEMPHVYIILMSMMLLVIIMSFIVPSGEYVRTVDPVTENTIVDPDSYHTVEKPTPTSPLGFGVAIYNGAMNAASIFFQIIMVCGTLEFLQTTGAFEAGVGKLVNTFSNHISLLPAVILLIFTILGNIGMQDGCLPLYPIAAGIMIRAGYDKVSAVGAGILGEAIGFSGGALNMFTVGISQEILGIPIFSGFSFRLMASTLFYIVTVSYILWYCKRIRKDPTKSVIADEYINQLSTQKESESLPLTWQRSVALIGLLIAVILQGYGPLKLGWGIAEITSLYVILTFVIVIIFKINPNKACEIYMEGAKNILPAAFVLAFSNAILVLMNNAKIIDTAIHTLVQALEGKEEIGILIILFFAIMAFEFLVSSGTGKAMLIMPILKPIGQIINMSRQLIVVVYQYAEGATQYIWPTSGTLLAALGLCKVRYQDWVKFAWKPILLITLTNIVMVILAYKLQIGPF